MKKILISAAAVASMSGSAFACGALDVGKPNWSTGDILSAIDSFILSNGFGCEVTVVSAPTKQVLPMLSSAAKPMLVSEFWANGISVEEYANAQEDGTMSVPGVPFPEAGEAWWVSKAFAEAYPELDTVEEVLARPDLFDGKFYGCPVGVGWGREFANRNLANGWNMAELGWTVENPGSPEGQAAIIIDSYNTGSNWFGYYWTPTSVAILNELVMLDYDRPFVGKEVWGTCYAAATGETDPACDHTESSYSIASVVTATSGSLEEWPEIYDYAAREMSMMTLGLSDDQMQQNGLTADEVAVWYLTNYEDEWTQWVDEDTADLVRAAL